jgi:hypothetical protein
MAASRPEDHPRSQIVPLHVILFLPHWYHHKPSTQFFAGKDGNRI